ncbi:MAG: hypothetical protein OQK76_11745 [Gammaproteobacteria bacterium]|nr:hypothetical protein [Gammaproteobacteria bacterium]
MTENENVEVKNNTAANLWTAIVLGVIALIVGIMPFFYLKDMVAP